MPFKKLTIQLLTSLFEMVNELTNLKKHINKNIFDNPSKPWILVKVGSSKVQTF